MSDIEIYSFNEPNNEENEQINEKLIFNEKHLPPKDSFLFIEKIDQTTSESLIKEGNIILKQLLDEIKRINQLLQSP